MSHSWFSSPITFYCHRGRAILCDPSWSLQRSGGSGQDRLDDLAVNVGQAEVAALEAVGQPCVIDAQEMQDRGVEVVDLDRVLDDVVGEVVGLAVHACRA